SSVWASARSDGLDISIDLRGGGDCRRIHATGVVSQADGARYGFAVPALYRPAVRASVADSASISSKAAFRFTAWCPVGSILVRPPGACEVTNSFGRNPSLLLPR